MPPVGFEPTVSAGEWPQTHALDREATGTGLIDFRSNQLITTPCTILTFIQELPYDTSKASSPQRAI